MNKKNLINLGFTGANVVMPYLGIVKTLFDNAESNKAQKEIELIKQKLGLVKVQLKNVEFTFLQIFTEKSIQECTSFEYLSIDYDEVFNILEIDKNSFKDILMSLESYGFICHKSQGMGYNGIIKVSSKVFWNSNLLEKISDNSFSFESWLKVTTEFLYENYRYSEEPIRIKQFIKEGNASEFLINPIMSFYLENNIIKIICQPGSNSATICSDFQVVSSELYKLYHNIDS